MRNKILFSLVLLLAFQFSVFAQADKLVPHKITLKSGKSFSLNLPAGYEITPAAEGLKRARFFAKAPDGRIFVTDMYDLTDNRRGAVYILDEFDLQTGKFRKVIPYLTNLKNPNSAQFYTDKDGQDWFYLAETDKLTRRKFTEGETKPTDAKPQVLATFPDYGLDYKYGGWHLTRTIAFSPAGKLYVSIGSSCNACDEKEKERATVMEMNADGSNPKVFARGLRNAVGLKWIGEHLWATNQGSDHLGLNKPDETFYALKDGADYGWASCYQANGKVFFDATPANKLKQPTTRLKSCKDVPVSYAYFPAHSSAMGFDYFNEPNTDELIKNSFLVALHGSTNKNLAKGYKIVSMRKGERLRDFITGFLQGKTVHGRPLDIMKVDADSFFFTDDHAGVVYFVRKKDAAAQINVPSAEKAAANENARANKTPDSPDSKTCWSPAVILLAILARSLF